MGNPRNSPQEVHRIVVKVGTRLITHKTGKLNLDYVERLVRQLADLTNQGIEVILVTSGAVGAGMGRMGIDRWPDDLPDKQAAAAVGQGLLLQIYEKLFAEYGLVVAQILLTRADVADRRRYINACNTFLTLLQWGVVPIINENDSVSVDEIKFGDNDQLSALVACLSDADLLVLLTTTDGLYTSNPHRDEKAIFVPVVDRITPEVRSWADTSTDEVARGGMITKLQAAEIATKSGIGVVITDGNMPRVLQRVQSGEKVGTYFRPQAGYVKRRKRWIAFARVAKGSVIIDDGAREALCNDGKSLLPVGVIGVKGSFEPGESIRVLDTDGMEIGRGLSNFSSSELEHIKSRPSAEIRRLVKRPVTAVEVIRRNNLVVHEPPQAN